MIDFTNCKRILSKAYNGANGKKIAIEYNGTQYMLKFPPSGINKLTQLSYINSCVSEHIGSNIFNMLGIEAQETLLGTFDVNGKSKLVCACKDFTAHGKEFYDFCSIKNTVIDSGHEGTGTELEDILESLEKQRYVDPIETTEYFWDMFVIDALLGNFDRHNGNWGFLVDRNTTEAELAPIFDCGSCLLPQADETIMKKVLSIILSVIMVLSSVPLTASAYTVTGTCGDNLTWTYHLPTRTLTVSGTGPMYDCTASRPLFCYYLRERVASVVIEEGVTTIGERAFADFYALYNVTLPDSLTSIGSFFVKRAVPE